jgi:hypothetical protein
VWSIDSIFVNIKQCFLFQNPGRKSIIRWFIHYWRGWEDFLRHSASPLFRYSVIQLFSNSVTYSILHVVHYSFILVSPQLEKILIMYSYYDILYININILHDQSSGNKNHSLGSPWKGNGGSLPESLKSQLSASKMWEIWKVSEKSAVSCKT